MGAEEPETKKLKLDTTEEQLDPIFDQFRNNKNEMFKLKYALDALKLGLDGSKLCMMKISAVNACAPVSFSMASVETKIHTSMERDDGVTADGFAVGSIFTDGIFVLENYINSGAFPKNQELRMILAKLLKYLSQTDPTMLPEKKHHLELEWAVIVSQHLLSKLTVNNKYLVDSYRMENCPCNDGDDLIVSMGDTSYGLLDGWLGRTDILIEDTLPVKVCTDVDDFTDGQPETQSVSSTDIEDKFSVNGQRQLLAQTIVFSFIQHKYNSQKMQNCLVPGIGIGTKNLLIYFYDSENDLLVGSTYLETFLSDYLSVENVVFLWLTLNYRQFCSGPDELMKKYPSGFVKLTGDHIEKYRNEVIIPAHRHYTQVVKETPWYKKPAFPMKEVIESPIELVQPKYV